MKIRMVAILGICCSLLFLTNCNTNENAEEVDSTENATDTLAEEKEKDYSGELPEMSIYNLPANWTNQNNEDIELEDLRGDILVAVMIYTSCKASCPRLVADVKRIHEKVDNKINDQVKYVFVSIDPEVDTPERLKEFAKENRMDNDQWMFLRGTKEDTRTFSATLSVNYKRISPMDFSHSNIISVFDQNGVLKFQKEGLGVDPTEVVEAIEGLAK